MALSKNQIKILKSSFDLFDIDQINSDLESLKSFEILSEEKQLYILKVLNFLYRGGHPACTDQQYNQFFNFFKKKYPNNDFILTVEPEPIIGEKLVTLPQKMLSTDKAYSKEEIIKWIDRIRKASVQYGLDENNIEFKVTAKLDGYAAFDDGNSLYTRGNGSKGRNISFVFDRGLSVFGDERGLGAGEIVINKHYFNEHLANYFDNTRNIQASIIAEKNLSQVIQKSIIDRAAIFYPFKALPSWRGTSTELIKNYDSITKNVLSDIPFETDGVVIEITNQGLKDFLGSTRHHHRWQIALKSNDESSLVEVLKVIPQVSRNGKNTPVVIFNSIRLSGAEISKATAHNYSMVKKLGIGVGSELEIVRSGLVIPKIERVIKKSSPSIPNHCISCGSVLHWIDDNLFCLNHNGCRDQIEKTIIHFFETLGNNDGLGPATISTFYDHGIRSIYDVYLLENDPEKLFAMGFKQKSALNIIDALKKSRRIEIEDWRFLAAFGINRLGYAASERILELYDISDLYNLDENDLIKIDGFAKKTSQIVINGFNLIKEQFDDIYKLNFNLKSSKLTIDSESKFLHKNLVFTGKMEIGSREDLEKIAKSLGAKVTKSVSSKTDFLILGSKVGQRKIDAAKTHNIKLLSEKEFMELTSN
ncbi:DNA ligase [Paraphotobacterium marinum]|uniref:DNA ligase n=1 Tax=Paraphotobacterium marinum TaxID=1755811 RepID=A0A220VDS7_9GAMM|nr:BRCT domain-containing protein [Paraphotobacterium marinum]ASK78497.1 DNA ligase [Paraphotobacterium marinum]